MQNDTRFNEVLDLFLLDRSLSLSAGTLRHYREKLNAFNKFTGDVAIEDVSHIQCRAYLAGMKERGLSPHTIGGHYRDLRAFFNWCLAEELLDTSPMARVTFKMKSWEPKQGIELSTVKQMLAVDMTFDAGRPLALFCGCWNCPTHTARPISPLSSTRKRKLCLEDIQ